MNVRNCKKCNRLFNYLAGPSICPACREALETKFQEVKKFIQDNNTVPLQIVAEECDVDVAQLRQWVREERLVFSADSVMGIDCELCGIPIPTGRYCDKCKMTMINDLSKAGRQQPQTMPQARRDVTVNPKMRYFDK